MNSEQIIDSLEKSLEENKVLFFNAMSEHTMTQAEKSIASIERRIAREKTKLRGE